MRKKLAILLISLHLFGNTEAGQVFKLPQLFTHYTEHKQLDHSLGFIEFLLMHYGGDDGTDTDNDQDQQLPCHNIHHTTVCIAYSPMTKAMPINDIYLWETRSYRSHLSGPIPDLPLPVLLQPPGL
ncbi:MAG TPA: hypothetical protein PLB49_04910 [Chitinophagaceae bacterium]|jgi:hypothetical protein|nr:hypothetical protein [Chitinophagaceae bacterium]HRG25253.1 hypothetical protein [Chitinophagaceae bacterium]